MTGRRQAVIDHFLELNSWSLSLFVRRPFMLQAKTEIELLEHLRDKDPEDENNIIRLQDHFVHRGHQCLVFEMLS